MSASYLGRSLSVLFKQISCLNFVVVVVVVVAVVVVVLIIPPHPLDSPSVFPLL
jgi:hypothetical protein